MLDLVLSDLVANLVMEFLIVNPVLKFFGGIVFMLMKVVKKLKI